MSRNLRVNIKIDEAKQKILKTRNHQHQIKTSKRTFVAVSSLISGFTLTIITVSLGFADSAIFTRVLGLANILQRR